MISVDHVNIERPEEVLPSHQNKIHKLPV